MKINIVMAVAFATLLLCGCGNSKLTKEKAQELLASVPVETPTVQIEFRNHSSYVYVPLELKQLADNHLATYNFSPGSLDGELNDDMKQYIVSDIQGNFYNLLVAKVGFGEITGIREMPESNSATVEYTTKVIELTPIGKAVPIDIQVGQTYPHTATFAKYDDGWRLQQR